MSPRTHERTVDAGIVRSSVLGTVDRTSGYGDSSSSVSVVTSRLGSLSWSVRTVILSYYMYQLGAASGTSREMSNRNLRNLKMHGGVAILEVIIFRGRHVN